jgi:uncharacterized protein (DUF1015 family)
LVSASPIVIADGHHRFETALAYRAERPADDAGAGAILAYVVELAPEELEIRSIYRLVDAPAGVDIVEVMRPFFDLEAVHQDDQGDLDDDAFVATSRDAGALGLVTPTGRWFARPRADAFPDGVELDTVALATALASVPGVSARYHHDAAVVVRSVRAGSAAAGVFVRPVRIDQIRTVAETRTRMPPKATFFWPKPRTGVLFRPL